MNGRITRKHRLYVKKICECTTVNHDTLNKLLTDIGCDYDIFCDSFIVKKALYDVLKNGHIDDLVYEVNTLNMIYDKYDIDMYQYKDIIRNVFNVSHELISYYNRNLQEKSDTLRGICSTIALMDHATMPYINREYFNSSAFFPMLVSDTIRSFTGISTISKIINDRGGKRRIPLLSMEHMIYNEPVKFFIMLISYLALPIKSIDNGIIANRIFSISDAENMEVLFKDFLAYVVSDKSNYI